MERERETRRPRDEDEDIGGPKKKRRGGQSKKNPPSRTIQQAPPSPLSPTANYEIVDGDVVGIDWRKQIPRLSQVGDQGELSICWVFSILDTIETIHEIKTGKKIQLSKQQLIDFVWPDSNYNTKRGYSPLCTLEYIEKNGVTYEHVYPYLSHRRVLSDDEKTTKFEHLYLIKGYGAVTKTVDISRILRNRPLIIRSKFDRSFMNMKDWSIYIPKEDAKASHSHGLVLVGEGKEIKDGAELNYWIVKNSWGTRWGKMGFGRIIKDDDNLKIEAWYPILDNDELPG